MVKLIEKIKLPSVGPDGNPISYKFIHKVTGRQLLEAQTLSEAGIKDGDVLRLQPEITAGAICNNCGANVTDGTAFCRQCGAPMSAPQQTYAPVQQPVYQQPVYRAPSKPVDMSKLVLIIGAVAVGLYLLAYLLLGFNSVADLDFESEFSSFLYLLADIGIAGFMADIVLYMFTKLKK